VAYREDHTKFPNIKTIMVNVEEKVVVEIPREHIPAPQLRKDQSRTIGRRAYKNPRRMEA
jgi:hypothetical protein